MPPGEGADAAVQRQKITSLNCRKKVRAKGHRLGGMRPPQRTLRRSPRLAQRQPGKDLNHQGWPSDPCSTPGQGWELLQGTHSGISGMGPGLHRALQALSKERTSLRACIDGNVYPRRIHEKGQRRYRSPLRKFILQVFGKDSLPSWMPRCPRYGGVLRVGLRPGRRLRTTGQLS